ncbi:MAG: DUF2092 domain-containing protein [Gammaproteobacteria bacterium]
MTVFSTPQNVYAKVSKPGSLDEAISYFIQELHMRLPLALLLVSQLPAERISTCRSTVRVCLNKEENKA